MKTLIVSHWRDVAGCGYALKRAFDVHGGDWQARAVRRAKHPFGYPGDITWNQGDARTRRFVERLWHEADVIHVMDDIEGSKWFPIRGQTVIVHHLGSRYRADPARISAYCQDRGFIEVTDSFDLMLYPHVRWLPVATDFHEITRFARGAVRGSGFRIAHAPTNRVFYSTDLIVGTVARLGVELDLIEGVSNAECIARKAAADLFIDGLTFGYGMNPIECWAMGIPVVSGLKDAGGRSFMQQRFGGFPFADATEDTLEDVLCHLIQDSWARSELGLLGRSHVERFHSERAVVRQTLEVYGVIAAVAA